MNWKIVKLGDIGEFKAGFGFPNEFQGKIFGDFPFAKVGDISSVARRGDKYISSARNFIDREELLKLKAKSLPKGTIVFAKIGEAIRQNFRAITSVEMLIDNNAMGLIPNLSIINADYLYYFLCQLDLYCHAGATTVPALRKSILEELEIPLPPLPEQQRIAAILDKADAIRRKRQQALQLADEFLRSVFLEMFGDPVTNPKSINILPMTDCFNITTGKLNSNAAIENGKYPFFTCAKDVYFIDDYAFDQEALLLAGNNAQADYDVKYYNGKFNAYQRTYVLTIKDKNWSYPFYKFVLEYQLQNLKQSSKGTSTKYITMEIMQRTMLPAPNIELQREFARRVQKVEGLKAKLKASQAQAEAQFNALSQRAFAGEL